MSAGAWVAFGVLVFSLALLLVSLFVGSDRKWGRIAGAAGVSGVILSVAVPATIASLTVWLDMASVPMVG